MSLTKAEVMRQHQFEYHATIAANPDYDKTELQYLMARGWTKEQIWEHAPDLAEDAGWAAPDWY